MILAVKLLIIGAVIVFDIALLRSVFLYKPVPYPQQCKNLPNHDRIALKNDPKILQRFIGALNIPSISYKIHQYDGPQMTRLIDYIQESKLYHIYSALFSTN